MLEQLIEFLVDKDPYFRHYWTKMDNAKQKLFIDLNKLVQDCVKFKNTELLNKHLVANEYLKRLYVAVQTKDFDSFIRSSRGQNHVIITSVNSQSWEFVSI